MTTTGLHVSKLALLQFILYDLAKGSDLSEIYDPVLN